MNLEELILRPLTRDEFNIAVEWAAGEGWNPGLDDAEIFWNTDPGGFIGAEYGGEIVATGSIVSYSGQFGFMGFFIVAPGLRGQGIGERLWYYRRDLLSSRLVEGAAIGMDGVFEMQDWYRRGGFEFTHRNLRMKGVGKEVAGALANPEIVPLDTVPFERILKYDMQCFGFARARFLWAWIAAPNAQALGYVADGELKGFGVIRKCREGYKIGPLFAENGAVATALFDGLTQHGIGSPIWLDVPEINDGAMELARRNGMKEVFGCARMYFGPIPELPWNRIFGITTFELG